MGYGEFTRAPGRWRSHDAGPFPTRDGTGDTLKQHLWGAAELVPTDANPDASGWVERCDCTPGVHPPRRGQRTVYKKAGIDDELTTAPLYHSQRVETDAGLAPYGLCDVGHQGLMHDEQFGLVYNRNRYLDPRTGRWVQRDSAGYVDGMSLYEYLRSQAVVGADSLGQKVCFHKSLWANEQRRYALIRALNALIDDFLYENVHIALDPKGKAKKAPCCLVADLLPNTTLPQQLVHSLAKSEANIYILVWGQPGYAHRFKAIRFDDESTRRWIKDKKTQTVKQIPFAVNDRERAVRLAHEMIHAYYQTEQKHGKKWSALTLDEQYLWRDDKGGDLELRTGPLGSKQITEEEAYTIGLTIATNVVPLKRGNVRYRLKSVTETTWDAKYTENKILKALGFTFERAAYSRHNPFDVHQAWVTPRTRRPKTKRHLR